MGESGRPAPPPAIFYRLSGVDAGFLCHRWRDFSIFNLPAWRLPYPFCRFVSGLLDSSGALNPKSPVDRPGMDFQGSRHREFMVLGELHELVRSGGPRQIEAFRVQGSAQHGSEQQDAAGKGFPVRQGVQQQIRPVGMANQPGVGVPEGRRQVALDQADLVGKTQPGKRGRQFPAIDVKPQASDRVSQIA